jgi:hypothetical protein
MNFTITGEGSSALHFECEIEDMAGLQRLLAAILDGRPSTTAAPREDQPPLLARAAAGERARRKPAIRIKKRKYTRRSVALTASTTCAFCANSFPARAGQKYCSLPCKKKAARLSPRLNGREETAPVLPAA